MAFFYVFQHQIVGADIVNLANVGMIQACYCPGFLFKQLTVLALQPFYGEYAAQPCVALFQTSPMPPASSGETISYGPSLLPEPRVIGGEN